ncbi:MULTISPECIES: glycosyltransferase family 2 protein [Clostridium]|uniref:glycosyltransferase family A protein n=1 Tax=Clostridium TaxID=1485 RepID=UPI0013F0EDA5|nr:MULTISPECIES: glycosyltransferase family 2 protein [Clostridium]MBY6837713.1 glycosyltransferase family 2 protein [Clostridium botulinum]NFG64060.1 glycosyltransferase family 2 protein [Clostridium botulinum]NFL35957.1 glycosyltransferase family 2 protein [Clostridium botulinum]NFM04682.1 glycosyltransferase family 2 protein [Clostridium botulinum]NFO29326.1 glycosyltransferase family 2 protein [Clostridium botulinum]
MISIIIPCYNARNYIDKNLNSLISQTTKNFEAIFIDDGSSDNSSKYIEKILKNSNVNFKILTIKHTGVGHARNLGIKKSNAPYIMFLDADDYLSSNAIEIFLNQVKKNIKLDFIFGKYLHELNNEIKWSYKDSYCKINEIIEGNQLLDLIFDNKVHICTSNAIYKSTLLKGKYFEENISYHEDLNYYYRAISSARYVKFTDNIITTCVIRQNSLSHKFDLLKLEQGIFMLDKLSKSLEQDNLSKVTLEKIKTKVIPNTCYIFFNNMCNENNDIVYQYYKRGYLKRMSYVKIENVSIKAFVKYLRIKCIVLFPNLYKWIWNIYIKNIKKIIRR